MFKTFKNKVLKESSLPSNTIYQNDNVFLIKYFINKDHHFLFKNWEKNRPPDDIRIVQIAEYFSSTNIGIVPGVIYAWQQPGENTLFIYDGIHRIMAAQKTGKELVCLIQIMMTSNEQDVIDDFLNINKSISVPSIYLEETNVLKKLVCQNVADEMCRKYPTFVSPSRKPYVYNFNRDNLVEFISTLQIDFTKQGIDKRILNELIGMNYIAKDYVMRNKITHPRKCVFHNFYLFYLQKSVIKDRLEQILS